MRRLTRWLLTAALVLGLAAPALAQIAPGSGLVLKASRSSVTISNSAAGAPLFTYDIPAGFAVPLHLKLEGTYSTPAAASPANLTCNYGGANASLTLLNASILTAPFPNSATNSPIVIDLFVRPTPTWNAATPMGVSLFGIVSASATTTAAAASATQVMSTLVPREGTNSGQVNMNSSSGNTISCQWQWAGASAERIITIWQGNLYVGE